MMLNKMFVFVLLASLFVIGGCKDITDSFRPDSFGNTREETQMVSAINEKYGNLSARGSPRFLEPMMTSDIVNYVPIDTVVKYSKDSNKFYAWFVYDNFDNDPLEIEWKYLNDNHVIHTFSSRTGDNFGRGAFILEQPEGGWPLGNYQVTIRGRGLESQISFEVIDGPTISRPLDILSLREEEQKHQSIVPVPPSQGDMYGPSGGVVEGRGWIGPLTYNIKGASFGEISVEQHNLHRYDNGKFSGPTIINIWGSAENNAHELSDSAEYSYGVMSFRVLVRYEDDKGKLNTAYDSWAVPGSEEKNIIRYGPGMHEYNITTIIPESVKQVAGRSTVMIEIENVPSWGTGGNRVAANLKYERAG